MTKILMVLSFMGMLVPAMAQAQSMTATDLIKESTITHRKVRANAQNLSRKERRQVNRRLQAIQQILDGSFSGGGPNPDPVYGPVASTTIDNISRKAGGLTYVIRFSQPTAIQTVSISSPDRDVKVYSAVAIMRRGPNERLYDLESRRSFVSQREMRVNNRNLVTEIEIQAEAWNYRAELEITVEGRDGERSFRIY